ncbi:uncharacterized protein LOC120337289 isoform X2 [Styela clava]
MTSLKEMCEMVDDFVANGGSTTKIDGSNEFWKKLNKDSAVAQLYTECLIYKYIAVSYGLGGRPLFNTLSQIKNISAPGSPHHKSDLSGKSPSASPRGSLTPTGKSKRGSGNFDQPIPENKPTPKKKFNISRRKSEDSKKSKKELAIENSDFRRKSKSVSKPNIVQETENTRAEKENLQQKSDLDRVLISLTYLAKMCDLTRWDFTKLRDVFLIWNKARGWEQNSSDYEFSVMKRFSMAPAANVYDMNHLTKCVNDVLSSVSHETGELSVCKSKIVGESVKYWEIRHKILARPEEAISVIKCLTEVAKKIFEDGEENKILPLLHILSETIIMSPHTPLELLQECYSTFEMFYVWPSYVAHPVKEVLDMIQLEMKCPGHFYRMIFFQDNEIPLADYLSAKMPSSETHVFIDESIPECEAVMEAFGKLRETRGSSSKLTDETGMFRYVMKHIFESVYGADCCDLATLEQSLESIPSELVPELCHEALSIMERASTMKTHGEAQDFLRVELETFSEKLVDFLEDKVGEKDASDMAEKDPLSHLKGSGHRRVSVLYETCRIRDPSSPARSSSVGQSGAVLPGTPRRNNSYLRRTASGSLDNQTGAKKLATKANSLAKDTPAELIGSKVSLYTFDKSELSDTMYELVRNSAKEYVQEKKRSTRKSIGRKRDSAHLDDQDAYRDSGVIDDEESNNETRNLTTAVQHLRIEETEEESYKTNVVLRNKGDKTPLSNSSSTDDSEISFTKLAEAEDSDSFWKEFSEKGFDQEENDDLTSLLKSMTFDQRKSFLLENTIKRRQSSSVEPVHSSITESEIIVNERDIPPCSSPTIMIERSESIETTTSSQIETEVSVESGPNEQNITMRRKRNESKKYNRLSRFVRSKRRSTRKDKKEGELETISAAESRDSVSSMSSTQSSTTSDELVDAQSLRTRTASDPVFGRKKRERWTRGTIGASSSPLITKNKRSKLNVDVSPRSSFNLSIRSLPGHDRTSIIGNDIFTDGKQQQMENDYDPSRTNKASTPTDGESPRKSTFLIGAGEDDEDARRRIDSGIGHEHASDAMRKRTFSSFGKFREPEDHGIGGVKFAVKEAMRASRRGRISISDALEERTIHKKVVKLVFVGNDKTVGHMARAYYNLRKRQVTRAPLFQHIDLRLYFIPIGSNQPVANDNILSRADVPAQCDVKIGELLGTFDSWYHTAVTLSINNLVRVLPKISPPEDMDKEYTNTLGGERQIAMHRLLAPQEVIASSLLSYSRFAVSRTDINMYRVVMVTSTGDVITDVFCCQLKIGHDAYTTAVKAGKFGKLGKLVDLSNDNGPPPAYTKIEYSKWSIDQQLIYTGKMEDTFYHTVCVTPMALCKNHFRGRDVLQLVLIDNEKREKSYRRASNNKLSSLEEVEIAGNVLDIGTMKIEVVRPSQGTFSLVMDNSEIYTSIKSVEISPCAAPELEMAQNKRRSRLLRNHYLMHLPIRTFWPATQ